MEKPVIQCVEKVVEVPQYTVQECIVEVPVIETHEAQRDAPKSSFMP